MIYPEDILNASHISPDMAAKYVNQLERKYIFRGKTSCHPKVYLAALKAIDVVKTWSEDAQALDACNAFLLNVVVSKPRDSEFEDEELRKLLKERDRLVALPPVATREVAYQLSLPFQPTNSLEGHIIGLYTTLDTAERVGRNIFNTYPFNLDDNSKTLVYYLIIEKAMDHYDISPSYDYISIRKYGLNGELISEWQSRHYNANGTVRPWCEK